MTNKNNLILTGSDYRAAFSIPGSNVYMLKTAVSIGWTEAAEGELIYAVGNEFPIGNKQNAFSFKGKLSIQEGEMFNILQNEGLVSAIQLPNVTISITSTVGGPSYTFSGLCINTSAIDVKAKDKETLRNLDWTAINVTN